MRGLKNLFKKESIVESETKDQKQPSFPRKVWSIITGKEKKEELKSDNELSVVKTVYQPQIEIPFPSLLKEKKEDLKRDNVLSVVKTISPEYQQQIEIPFSAFLKTNIIAGKENNPIVKKPLPFEKLKCPTRTVMIYSNVCFEYERWFDIFPITPVSYTLTKKKKNIDKKKLKAPYGAIISLRRGNQFRGLNLSKKKKHWCAPTCRKTETRNFKEYPVNTVTEETYYIEGTTDTFGTRYYCHECDNYYTSKQLIKIPTFLNQLTIVLSLGRIILNVMMFKDSIKVAGCKTNDDAVEAIMVLWNHYIRPTKGYIPKFLPSKNQIPHPQFIFKLVMMNLDFKLDFPIDRNALNKLMNKKEYADRIHMSEYESTSHANVNIKMLKKKAEDFYFDCLVLPDNEPPYFIKCPSNEYKTIKKNANVKHTTFIVFSSSKIILSGKYKENMMNCYDFFIRETTANRDFIEEKIKPKGNFQEYLRERGYELKVIG